jgi:transposase-like protein
MSERHDPDWLSVRDVARRLSVNPKQVRKWIQAGQFDEIVVFSTRLTRISLAAYQRFVEKSRAA